MDKEKFLQAITEIGTCEDEVERRTKLTELSEGVVNIFDSNSRLESENTKYQEDNEKLREANMQLFLRVGSNKTEEELKEDKTGIKKEEEKPPRKFSELFDEKGNLK